MTTLVPLVLFLTVLCIFILSQSRPVHDVSDVPGEGSRYWIDSSVELALATIMSSGIYYGRVIEQTSGNQPQGLLRIEEIKSPIVSPIPIYISRFTHYTEKDCRAICLQIAQCINIMHNAGIAHRNLHLGNVVIDPFVSHYSSCFVIPRIV